MTRLAERAWRLLVKPQSLSTMMLFGVVIVTPADTTRRTPGYAGIVSLPVLEASDTISLNTRIDQVFDRRDTRAERGRVLYAAGHEPAKAANNSAARSASRTARAKSSCPPPPSVNPLSPPVSPPSAHQTVVQDRTPSSPNS